MSYPPPPGDSPNPYPSGPPPTGTGYAAPRKGLRGRIPLRLALIFGVLGLALTVAGGVVLGTKSFSQVDKFGRVSVSAGSGTVRFANTGSYLAYYEASDVTSGMSRVPVPAIRLTSPAGQARILDTLYGGASRTSGRIKAFLTYNYNGHKGIAIYQFKITEAGTYRVDVAGEGSGAVPGSDVAFGKSIAKGTVVGTLLLLPGILLLIAAIVLLIVGLVKRSRHKKELRSGPYPGGPYPGGPPPGQAYGQQPPPGYGPPPGQGYAPPPPGQGYAPPPTPGYGQTDPGFGQPPG